MQEILWIRENLDYYERTLRQLEKRKAKITDIRQITKISNDFIDLKRRIDENLCRYCEKIEVEETNFVGRLKIHIMRKKIRIFEAYDNELRKLRYEFRKFIEENP